MGTCILADLDECYRVGTAIRDAAANSGRRIVFVASSALSHRLVRDPASWPTAANQALDREFLMMLREGRLGEARQFLNGFAEQAQVEMGGRNLATMLGVLDGTAADRQGALEYGEYGPSSGAGHTNFAIRVQ
jgi:3,4-dihydroxyphenylacetate 2,3-dioxygenase